MNLLVLNKRPLQTTPYHQWFEELGAKVILFSAKNNQSAEDMRKAESDYSEAHFFDDYDTGHLEQRVLELHKKTPLSRIIALSEVDLFRAACLREALALPGLRPDQAVLFRDKFKMKACVSLAGLKVPQMTEIRSATDLLSFIARVGLPIVVKPRSLAGSMGITVVRSEADLQSLLLQDAFSSYELDSGFMAEQFIQGQVYHIDGIASGNQVLFSWPSEYLYPLLTFFDQAQPTTSLMLAAKSSVFEKLQSYCKQVVASLPFPEERTAFHCEVFIDANGEVSLCEIAARPAGGGITDMVADAFDVDLVQIGASAQAGLPENRGFPSGPKHLSSTLLFPKQKGELKKIPPNCPFHFTRNYSIHGKVGETYHGAQHSIDRIASLLYTAEDEATLRQRAQELVSWFDSETEWIGATS